MIWLQQNSSLHLSSRQMSRTNCLFKTVNAESLLEILELAQENNVAIEPQTVDFLFNKWATEEICETSSSPSNSSS